MQEARLSSQKIFEYMREHRLTQKQMAELMGITPNTLRSYLLQDYPKITRNKEVDIRRAMKVKEFIKLLDEGDDNE